MAMILGSGLLPCVLAACMAPAARPAAGPAAAPTVVVAAAPWASGVQAKESLRRAALAAGAASLTPETVGYYMDVQEARLREQLAGSGVQVARVGDDLTVSLPGNGLFASDRADLDPGMHATLDTLGAVMQKFDKTIVEIAGHSDSAGTAEHNQELSARRAAAVASYLQGRGVARTRVATVGLGESRPVASNATAEGRARNRRVELTLSPLVKGG